MLASVNVAAPNFDSSNTVNPEALKPETDSNKALKKLNCSVSASPFPKKSKFLKRNGITPIKHALNQIRVNKRLS